MRKLVIIVIVVLVPIGLWTAGCRENRQASFPSTPEMKSIARAPEQIHPTRPPVIPAAIDREILATPDPETYGRLRQVMDRTEMLAARYAEPGLVVSPVTDREVHQSPYAQPVMAYNQMPSANHEVIPEAVIAGMLDSPYHAPAPSPTPEFWSKPAKPLPTRTWDNTAIPADISAMMPSSPVLRQTDSEPEALPSVFMPEDIPGVFMGSDGASETSGWIGMAPRRPAVAGPEPVSLDSFASVSVDDVNQHLRRQDWRPQKENTGDLDLVALLAPLNSPAPPSQSEKLVELFENTDIRQALEPLPDISELILPLPGDDWEKPASSAKKAVPAEKTAMAEKTTPAGTGFMPPPPSESQGGSLSERDLYRMDLPAAKAAASTAEPVPQPTASEPALNELSEPPPTPTRNAASTSGDDVMRRLMQASSQAKANQRPSEEPLRPVHPKSALDRIDSSVDVPPLKF